MIQMIVLDISHHCQLRIKLKEGAIALISLRHHEVARAVARVAAEAVHLAADNHRRINATLRRDAGDHCARRGLAVRASDRHAPRLLRVQQRRQNVAAMQHRNAAFTCLHQLRIIGMNGGRNHDRLRIIHLTGIMPHIDHGALLGQMRGHMPRVQIGAAHVIAASQKHVGQSAHAGTADADEMYIMQIR